MVEYSMETWSTKDCELAFKVAKAQGFKVQITQDQRQITIEGEDFPHFFGSLQEALAQQKKD